MLGWFGARRASAPMYTSLFVNTVFTTIDVQWPRMGLNWSPRGTMVSRLPGELHACCPHRHRPPPRRQGVHRARPPARGNGVGRVGLLRAARVERRVRLAGRLCRVPCNLAPTRYRPARRARAHTIGRHSPSIGPRPMGNCRVHGQRLSHRRHPRVLKTTF